MRIGRSGHAYVLAEKHEDFRSLVELCQDPAFGSAQKTAHFIDKYQEDFAFVLFQWLIEQGRNSLPKPFFWMVTTDTGRPTDLLSTDEAYGQLLLKFFDQTDNARVSWLHDIALTRYHQANTVLLKEAIKTRSLIEKQVSEPGPLLAHV